MTSKRIFHDIDQNTPEWEELRFGKITASNFGLIMANYGKAFGEPAKKYAMRIALESITKAKIETYNNKVMDRGHELEPLAREQYEDDTLTKVNNGGFMEYGKFGDSIDGLVEKDGGIEIKSVIYSTHFKRFLEGGIDTSYKWQICGHIWIHDLKWCDYVSYCPEFPSRKNLYIFQVNRDEAMIEKLKLRLTEFIKLVDLYREKIK